jgi:hypothetical protein
MLDVRATKEAHAARRRLKGEASCFREKAHHVDG